MSNSERNCWEWMLHLITTTTSIVHDYVKSAVTKVEQSLCRTPKFFTWHQSNLRCLKYILSSSGDWLFDFACMVLWGVAGKKGLNWLLYLTSSTLRVRFQLWMSVLWGATDEANISTGLKLLKPTPYQCSWHNKANFSKYFVGAENNWMVSADRSDAIVPYGPLVDARK